MSTGCKQCRVRACGNRPWWRHKAPIHRLPGQWRLAGESLSSLGVWGSQLLGDSSVPVWHDISGGVSLIGPPLSKTVTHRACGLSPCPEQQCQALLSTPHLCLATESSQHSVTWELLEMGKLRPREARIQTHLLCCLHKPGSHGEVNTHGSRARTPVLGWDLLC